MADDLIKQRGIVTNRLWSQPSTDPKENLINMVTSSLGLHIAGIKLVLTNDKYSTDTIKVAFIHLKLRDEIMQKESY